MIRRVLAVVAACFSFSAAFSQTITTGTISPATYCAGAAITVNFNASGTFNSGNVYTAEISNASGTYVGTVLGTLTSTASGNLTINGTVPISQGQGAGYRVRVTSSNPVAGLLVQSATVLTVNALSINAPSFAATSFCQGQTFNVPFTLNGNCALPNTPANNVFTAELSDNFGSFVSPTAIGTLTSAGGSGTFNISSTIPTTVPGGNGYRIRVRSTNPGSGLTSANNTSGNITVSIIGMNSPTHAATTYCAGATFALTNSFPTSCNFLTGNVFTAQLSDASGNFTTTQDIGTSTSTTAGNFNVTIPSSTAAGTAYRIRIVSSNPVRTSIVSGNDITINQFGIDAPTLSTSSFCQGSAVTVTYTIQNSCNFPNTPSANVFTAQLSNSSGSFASPTNIGTVTRNNGGTISATIPVATPAGSGYRIRVVSSNPTTVVGADNGVNLTVTASSGTPAVFGTAAWNSYIYSGTNATITNNVFLGTYTETNLSFVSTNRWAAVDGPGTANASSGSAYSGCAAPATNYSMSFKRTNFTCGYYQIDFPTHDDDLRLFVNGVLVFSHIGCCDNHTNAWTGFLGTTSQVEVQVINFGGPGLLSITVGAAPNPLTVSPTTTICTTQSTTLTASSALTLSYAWTPTTGLTPANGLGATVTAQPASSITYTVTGTDAATNCTVSKTVPVTVVSAATVPTLTVTNSTPTICSGITASTITVSGANTYTWTPAAGLSSTTGSTVIANPASNTTYTVTGSTGCQTATATVPIVVQNVPSSPATTTFGTTAWNAYAYNDMTFGMYYGLYTENNLSFNTATRWGTSAGPSAANATSGSAYSGCTVSTTNNSVSFKRTNFTCGYYQMNINYQDDRVTMLVNGVQVFQNNGATTTAQNNVWSGFLNTSSTVELQLINTGGPGRLDITFAAVSGPQVLGPNVVVCPGNSTPLTSSATAYPSATYHWSVSPTDPTLVIADPNAANTTLSTTLATASQVYTVTNTITDAGGTGCTATRTETVTVAAVPNTQVTPSSATIVCPTQTVTLTATGANTYTWSPTTGLTIPPSPSNVVVAQPTSTTTYTVTGDNGCATNTATVTVTVVPLPDYNTFPTNVWNIYGFNSQTIGTNYQGFYTDNGTGTPSYSFNTGTRWSQTSAPSTASALNGAAWQGCTMPTTNYSLSFKRTNFVCGTYTIDIPAHDDMVTLFVNGVQVAQHNGAGDTHTAFWTGVLTTTSTVEFQLVQGSGNAYLAATFNRTAPSASQSIWVGTTNTDWFTASNWCNAVPTPTIDALIPAGAPNNPIIGGAGAQARNVTISPAVAATSVSSAVAAGNLSMGAFNLDVYNTWTNNGIFNAGAGTVSFVGANAATTITGATAFNNVVVNRTNSVTIPASTTHTVAGSMNFISGIVQCSGQLRFLATGSATGASDLSHVAGLVGKVGNTAFTFPVGRGGKYRPASISAPSTITDTWTVQYLNTSILGVFPNTSRSITLDHVSGLEWWQIQRPSGSTPVTVTLSWDASSQVADPPSMRVAAWNGSLWADLGNSGTTGTAAAGTVTTATASSFTPAYTLATTTSTNALPVRLSDLQCGINAFGYPEINWTTEVEINSDHFEVERSDDGRSFKSVGVITSNGDSRELQKYSFEDVNAPDGKLYYRLKQVDRDKHSIYYEVCSMTVVSSGLSVSPNPTTGKATIRLQGTLSELTVINNLGQKVSVAYEVKGGLVELDMSSTAPGVYFVRVSTADKSGVLKLVKS